MDKNYAIKLIQDVFQSPFDREQFITFTKNLFNFLDTEKNFIYRGNFIPDAYKPYINTLERIGKYEDAEDNKIDVLIVHLKKEHSIEYARTMQRNFIAWYLGGSRGGELKDAALVAFYTDNPDDWRFSLVKMDYQIVESATGKIKTKTELTPARRFSFLVGKNENSHTAQRQLLPTLQDDKNNPLLSDLEKAFNIEVVTQEFFEKYKSLFLDVKDSLDRLMKKDPAIAKDFADKGVDPVDFSKKLLGQIVFLYFLQKKGWFGVERDSNWGTGPKNFLRLLFEKMLADYKNFFNEILEPLFYEALAKERDDDFYSRFNCKIPFLNGGLFDPLSDYDWVHTDILLPDELFSNQLKTKEGDLGTGILDIFDRYNFTVKEDEPLEKEVAVDPEMLGKVFENLLEVKDRKSKGTYYTPREIVHYMCQESLINYLVNECEGKVNRIDIETLIQYGESAVEHDATYVKKMTENHNYKGKYDKSKLPKSIEDNAQLIDDKLKNIRVCDPAIGSGAFPVGMMNEIIRTRNTLTNYLENKKDRSIYNFKRDAIQNSLYGVDIDPGAVEIAKLRLWLSLVVDEQDIKQIKPLPNLDYKIMQGNSLLEEFEGVKLFDEELISKPAIDDDKYKDEIKERIAKLQREYFQLHFAGKLTNIRKNEMELELKKQGALLKHLSQPENPKSENMGLFDIFSEAKKKAQELKQLHKEFFEASQKTRKDEIKSRIEKLEWELIETTLREQNKISALKQLEQYKKTNIKPFFLWRLNFAEVFEGNGKSGFDVVIANPPYIGEKGHKEMFREIKNANLSKYYLRNMDIFYFFFHLAIDLGKDKASIAFVTTNYYPTATGAKKLRQDFKQRTVIKNLINLNELKIFESAQGQHNMITILQKGHDLLANAKTAITRREGYEKPEILTNILNGGDEETDYFQISQENLYENDDCHMRLSFKKVNVLLDKIQSESLPLYKICDVNKGIETGANEVFIFNSLPLFYQSLNEKERALIKPFYKNSDVSRYHFKKSSKHILYFPNNINIEDYPTISKYLKENKKVLSERAHIKRSNQAWYTLLWPRDSKLFEQTPKIITSYRPQTNSFCYTENQFYSGTDTYYIVNPKGYTLKFIFGIINSRLALTWLKEKGKLKGSVLEMTGDVIEQIIIPRIETDNRKKISTQIEMFVQNILFITNDDNYLQNSTKQVQVKDYERQIDQLVYKLYGLTPEEISVVEETIHKN